MSHGMPNLRPVSDSDESVADRIQRLQDEAKALASDHVRDLIRSLIISAERAKEIAAGGDVYPAGIRDLAVRLAEKLDKDAKGVEVLLQRM